MELNENELTTLLDDIVRFEKSDLYAYLEKDAKQRLENNLKVLVDRSLGSSDIEMVKIGNAIRRDALFWSTVERIRHLAQNLEHREEETAPDKVYADYSPAIFG